MSEQTLNLVNNIVINAEQSGVARIALDNINFDGKNVLLEGKSLISFGSYSYLGLEVDDRLKDGAIQAIANYGIQYPSSRIYSYIPLYTELNVLLERIFQSNVVLTTSLSLGHMGVMPVVVGQNDLVILDQHVHSSVQDAAQRLKAKGIEVTVVRHNDLVSLEQKVIASINQYQKVWYAIDGIYSMYGDTAPIEEIELLLNKYDNLYLYADDAHGVSSFGKNGSGWVLSKINLHKKMVLSTGMAKAFGTMGGVFIIPDENLYAKVKNCTGSLIFSGPHPVPIVGASISSAQIHLSQEIYERQQILQEKIKYCSHLLKRNGIPDISDDSTPIFFIAISKLSAGIRLVKKMIESGYLTNLASFPAVSEVCTGVRFTITLHHSNEDIEGLVEAFVQNYPVVLTEEKLSIQTIRKAFRKVHALPNFIIEPSVPIEEYNGEVVVSRSIQEIDKEIWERSFPTGELFDWNSLTSLEQTFTGNELEQHNWQFYYVQIFNKKNELILMTLFTAGLIKDDMLADSRVSEQVEYERKSNEYFMTSKSLVMGTQLSEGNHLYIDKAKPEWKQAFELFLKETEKIAETEKANSIVLRDFGIEEKDLEEILKAHSYLQVELPDSHILENNSWVEVDQFLSSVNRKRRKYLNQIVLKKEENFKVNVHNTVSDELVRKSFKLYKNVMSVSFELNTFSLPFEFFKSVLKLPNWELLTLCSSKEEDEKQGNFVAIILGYKSSNSYHPILIGLDYSNLDANIYPQMLWQVVKRANRLGLEKVHFGFTASQNKRKFGAEPLKKFAFVKSKDNFNQMVLNNY